MAMIKRHPTAGAPHNHRGFSLVEVLVALLVLSIGLLGLAGLQAGSVQANNSAYLRSQATVLAYDLLDRMRANRAAALDGDYNRNIGDSVPSGSNLAEQDLASWLNTLGATLPSGDGSVDMEENRVTVVVQWADNVEQGTTTSFDMTAEL